MNDAILVPDNEVSIAIAIEIDKIRRDKKPRIGAIERVISIGARRETGTGYCAGVLEVGNLAVTISNNKVSIIIIVEINKYRCTIRTRVNIIQRIGGAAALRERGIGRCAGVLIVMNDAVVITDRKVPVTITVQVSQCECTQPTHGNVIKWIGRPGALRETRGSHRTGILEVCDGAMAISDDKVVVAVTVKVGEGRRAVRPH